MNVWKYTQTVQKYVGCSKSIRCDFFTRKLMKHRRCAVAGRWRVPSCLYVEFFPPADSVSRVRVRMYMQHASHCHFLWKCHLVTQIESFSAAFSSGGSTNNRKEPCQESKVPVVPQECCVWPRKFESASARISRTLSARPNYWSKWNVPNQCLSPLLCKFLDSDTTVLHDQSPHLVNELVI
jgi:hypothetical protein